jgi:chitodextrinase
VAGKPHALLTWEDKTDSESGFTIQRKQGDDGSWVQLATVGANTTTYTDTTLAGDTSYWYRVYAYDDTGRSAFSNEDDITTVAENDGGPIYSGDDPKSAYISPSDDTDEYIFSGNKHYKITISMEAPQDGENNLDPRLVLIDPEGNQEYEASYSGSYPRRAHIERYHLAKTGTYTIRTRSSGGTGKYTLSLTVTPFDMPENLSESPVAGNPYVLLTWEDKTDSEQGFTIQRKKDDGGWGNLANVGADTNTYTDTALAGNASYRYRVSAYDGTGQSAYSNELHITRGSENDGGPIYSGDGSKTAYISPSDDTDEYIFSGNKHYKVTISMQAPHDDLDNLLPWLQLIDPDGNEENTASPGGTGTDAHYDNGSPRHASITDYHLTKTGTYTIRTRSYDGIGKYTLALTVTPFDKPEITSVSTVDGELHALLTWEDKTDSEQGFGIERKKDDGGWANLVHVGTGTTTYTDTTVAANTFYWYRVYAYDDTGRSAYSNELHIVTAVETDG